MVVFAIYLTSRIVSACPEDKYFAKVKSVVFIDFVGVMHCYGLIDDDPIS